MTDNYQNELYQKKASQVWRWQWTAREYICAANVLLDWYEPYLESDPSEWSEEKHYATYSPLMLLYATAVENMLKVIRIAQGVPATINGKFNSYLASHDLNKYADDAKIELSQQEMRILDKLRDLIEAGKYPIAKDPTRNRGAWSFAYPGDIEKVWDMLELLEDYLRSLGVNCMPETDIKKLCRKK